MSDQLLINSETVNRLQNEAHNNNCSVDELINRLLDLAKQQQSTSDVKKINLLEAIHAGSISLWDWNFVTNEAVYTNEWKKSIGYRNSEFEDLHENFTDHIHPDDLPAVKVAINRTTQEQKQHVVIEFRLRHKNGTYRWVMARGSVLKDQDGQANRMVGALLEINTQKQAEEALRQSEERYRKVIENLNDMCVLFDKNLQIVMANQITVAYTGLSLKELLYTPGKKIFTAKVSPTFMALLLEAYQTNKVQTDEMLFQTPYGQRNLIIKHIPILDDAGVLENIVTITNDITEHKQIQENEFQLKLEKERVDLLTRFIQDAAHEFRTPLSSIKSSLYLMEKHGLNDYQQLKNFQINQQVDRISRLVNMLIMMVKLERYNEVESGRVNISEIITTLCHHFQTKSQGTPHIICHIQDALPTIYGDGDYLTEAIKQLLDNAIRFTPKDGLIEISVDAQDSWLQISIKDNGIGISEEASPQIFQTFWREDHAHTTPGFGLGLPIARKIIHQHHGEITIESQRDQGTEIQIKLPIHYDPTDNRHST